METSVVNVKMHKGELKMSRKEIELLATNDFEQIDEYIRILDGFNALPKAQQRKLQETFNLFLGE